MPRILDRAVADGINCIICVRPNVSAQARDLHAARLDAAQKGGKPFLAYLKNGEQLAVALEKLLGSGSRTKANETFRRLKANCNACHGEFRN